MNEVILSEVFLKIINMSISASWLVLAVLLLRLVLKKAPKWVSVLLWGFVAVRLICPFSIESMLSLIPSAETVSPEIMMDWTPEISTGIGSVDTVINPIITKTFAPQPLASANPLQILIPVAAIVWLAGTAAMLLYTAVSYFLLRKKVATAVLLRNNIYQSENVASPFVLGIIKPKIYLPFHMDGQNLEHVIAHEQAHILRKDHWWKPLGFLILALHWFNPLLWLGYVLLCRDIELACDEKVISKMDNASKADYTQALVACSVNRRSIAACPLAFGEVGVKERVKSVMHYKKPAFWIIIAAVVTCIVVAVCFLTNPKDISSGTIPDIHSHTYVVEEVTYEDGMYSFTVVAGENSPIYAINEEMVLASLNQDGEESTWEQLGKLEETTLTKESFDDLFKTSGLGKEKENAKSIRKNTVKAWRLSRKQEVLYYVLQQKNGDLYLAYGYQAPDQSADPGSFEEHIRWLFKLSIDTSGMSGMVAKSGDDTIPMVSFPKGTMIKDYVGSVYWLTINPGEDELAPFTVWRDGEEVHGIYTAYDAETFEPIKHFIPSGLAAQTYLFQNADPTRGYIVLATFSTQPNAQIYAFGAKFIDADPDNSKLLSLVSEIAYNPDCAASSNPFTYIEAKRSRYNEILTYGSKAVNVFVEQLRAGEDGLQGYIMAVACADITGIGDKDLGADWATAQQWLALYDKMKNNAVVGGVDNVNALYGEVKLTDSVSDSQESSYQVSAFLPATDLSNPGQVLADKIADEWKIYDGMTQQQQWTSSHLWGVVYLNKETWKECEQAVGVTIDNPLESIDWLHKTGYFGTQSVDPSTPVTHVQATAYATHSTDRTLSEISVTAGYNKGNTKITLSARVSATAGTITTGGITRGYATFEHDTTTTGSGAPVLLVTTNETNSLGYYNGDYFDPTAYWVKDNVFYTLRVFGDEADRAQIQETLERILAEI